MKDIYILLIQQTTWTRRTLTERIMVNSRENSTKQSHMDSWRFLSPRHELVEWVTIRHMKIQSSYGNFTEKTNLNKWSKSPTETTTCLIYLSPTNPFQVHETKTLPGWGTSDHDIVFHEIKVIRGRIKQNPRQVKSYKKACWSKKDFAIFTNTFIAHKHKDPNHLWDMFKAEVKRLSILHIPTRQIKSRADG